MGSGPKKGGQADRQRGGGDVVARRQRQDHRGRQRAGEGQARRQENGQCRSDPQEFSKIPGKILRRILCPALIHRNPSSPFTWSISSPPIRLWTRPRAPWQARNSTSFDARSIGAGERDRVEARPDIGRVQMPKRHVQRRPHAAHLHHAGTMAPALAQPLAHPVAARDMPERAMFAFAALADKRTLAIGVDPLAPAQKPQPAGRSGPAPAASAPPSRAAGQAHTGPQRGLRQIA